MAISFNTIPGNVRVPLFYAEVDNSAAFTPSFSAQSLLIGQKTDEGVAEVNVPVLVSSKEMADKLFGRGSSLARMVAAYREIDSFGTLYCIPVADPEDATAASAKVSCTGSAGESGSFALYVDGKRYVTAVSKAESGGVLARIKDQINADKDSPVTATYASDAMTLTAKNKGTLGNDVSVAINIGGVINGEVPVAGLTFTATAMTGGAGDVKLEEAITAMGDEPFEFIGHPFCESSVLKLFQTAMDDTAGRWSPFKQLYGHVYTAKRDTAAKLKSLGEAQNDQHLTIVGVEPNVPNGVDTVVAAFVARTAVFIKADPARPTQTGALGRVRPAPAHQRFLLNERQALLNSGIATLMSTNGSPLMIERAVTTYQKNAFGDGDASYLDSETLHTLAFILRRLRSRITSKYGRHKLANDGTRFGAGQAIVTPNVIRGELIAEYRTLEELGIVENAKAFKEHLIVERNKQDPNRLDVLLPPDLVNQLRVFAVLNQFRLQYEE